MPIYEYECDNCHKRTSVLTLRVGEKADAACRHCASRRLHRLMSRFATPRSEEARIDALSDPSSLGDVDENDPKSLARMMRRMGKQMGDDFSGPEFDEAIEELESGGDLDDDSSQGGDDL